VKRQRLLGLAAAVILCSGAQGHGRQTYAAYAVYVDRTMWKASRSTPEISGLTTKRKSQPIRLYHRFGVFEVQANHM
jgi:hypothetical protein